jgi:hypothetical protein
MPTISSNCRSLSSSRISDPAVSVGLEVVHFIGQRPVRPMLVDVGQNIGLRAPRPMPSVSRLPTLPPDLGEPLERGLVWRGVASSQKCLGGSNHSPPRLDLRERQLPWARLSIPCAVVSGNRRRSPPALSVADVAYSKTASASIDLPIHRAVIAVRPVAWRHDAGGGGRPAVPGVPVHAAKSVDANNVGAIGVASPWSFSPNRRP